MGVFDKIKSSVADVSQKNYSWASDASTKTKSSVASVFNKISTQLHQKNISGEVSDTNDNSLENSLEHIEQVTANDVKERNGKARSLIDNLVNSIKELLAKVNIEEVIVALQEYQKNSGKDISPLIDFIKQLAETVGDVATKGVLGFLIFLRDTPFSSILKLAKSIVKLIPIPGIPIIIMILEMMIKVEWLLDKVLDIIIKDIERKQSQSAKENLLTT